LPYLRGTARIPAATDHLSKFYYSIVQAKRCEKARGESNHSEVLGVDLYMAPGNGHGGCWPSRKGWPENAGRSIWVIQSGGLKA
jgi:hypothetical protein